MIYELKATLKDVGIPVTRIFQMEADCTFYDLHQVMQALFDWEDYHLHEFVVLKTIGKKNPGVCITQEKPDHIAMEMDNNEKMEKEERLQDWFIHKSDAVMYLYDYGDSWEHEIVLMKIVGKDDEMMYPRCLAAEGIAPPEDSRMDVMAGILNLKETDNGELLQDIEQNLSTVQYAGGGTPKVDYWPETLATAKQFCKMKPWNVMEDDDIFAIEDPVTGELLFCSVMGHGGQLRGLAVYIGESGFRSLLDMYMESKDEFDILQHQHSLLVTFEDRNDIDPAEYKLIKQYDVPFRGKKSWPSFVSFIPSYFPWLMDNKEARVMLLALEQTLIVCQQVEQGLPLPNLLTEGKVLVKSAKEGSHFQDDVMDMETILDRNNDTRLTISEFELKRVSKIKKRLPITIEFTMTYVNMPIVENENERPIFPLTVIVADQDEDIVLHHELYEQQLDTTIAQREFINMLHNLDGIPLSILTDEKTYYYIEPLVMALALHVEVVEHLPVVDSLLEGLEEYLATQKG